MKNNFIKILLTLIIITCSACTNNKLIGISTPWSDCQDNLNKAAEIAGFQFPMLLSNYTVRAMKDMIEITYPLDETRYVTVRKSITATTVATTQNTRKTRFLLCQTVLISISEETTTKFM